MTAGALFPPVDKEWKAGARTVDTELQPQEDLGFYPCGEHCGCVQPPQYKGYRATLHHNMLGVFSLTPPAGVCHGRVSRRGRGRTTAREERSRWGRCVLVSFEMT